MTILAIGGTGQIGSLVVEELARHGAQVRALGTKPRLGGMPPGVELVTGDVLDVDFMRGQLRSVSTVFLLHPAVADELTRALLSLALIEEAGIARIVYLSMIGADRFADSPRAAAKLAAEATIARRGLSATILRPNALFQNDIMQKDALMSRQTYATPVGSIGLTMIDGRDVAEVAARELLRRERSCDPLPTETIELVGPESFTGESIVRLWSEVLGKLVTYAGDDLEAVQTAFRTAMPSADAYSLAMIFRGIVQEGVLGDPGAADRLAGMLGHPLRTYRAFAEEIVVADNP
ncbi:SDR family oxidoreductase [Lichenicoccus sp.]|uniref:SDR family oxidoreductase n=1 Tax=Lichenicoccus sp. TaxID=2781899 RepID=UPI003D0CE39E